MRTATIATALVLAAAGCNEASEPSTGEASRAGREAGTIAVACRSGDSLPVAEREAIESAARGLLDALRRGDDQALWAALHPQARRDDQRGAFMESLADMRQRLSGATGEPTLEQLWHVDVSGGANQLARATCGDASAPTLQLMTNAGDEDVAVISLLSAGDPFTFATTVQLRRRGEAWRLVGLQVNPARYRGHSDADFYAAATRYFEAGKHVPAYLMLGVAQTLATRGAAIQSATKAEIDASLQAVQKTRAFVDATSSWDIGGDTFAIQGVSLVATEGDLSPVFKYVGEGGLVEELLGRDADKLMDHVRTRWPELGEHFDAVVFEAYTQRPTEPGRAYDAYRVVRFFDRGAATESG